MQDRERDNVDKVYNKEFTVKPKFLKLSQFSLSVQYLNKIIFFSPNLTKSETLFL